MGETGLAGPGGGFDGTMGMRGAGCTLETRGGATSGILGACSGILGASVVDADVDVDDVDDGWASGSCSGMLASPGPVEVCSSIAL